MSTPAIEFLKLRRLRFEVIHYPHLEKGAEYAARATGYPLDRTIKTLVVEIVPKRNALVLVRGDRHLDLKRLARALDAKKAELADTATAERLTGYHIGGISPFGTKQALPIVMDENILDSKEILINAGRRGTMLKMSPVDICTALDCILATVSTRREEEKGQRITARGALRSTLI
jgi:Cys-tRNA(Pro)/Cys-tRNA(Cys) deacylase